MSNEGPKLLMVLSMSCAFIARLLVRGRESGFKLPKTVQASLKELIEVGDVES